jgi:hypothetical protein
MMIVQLPDTSNNLYLVAPDTGRSYFRLVFHNNTGSVGLINNLRLEGPNHIQFSLLTHYSIPGRGDTLAVGGDYIINLGLDAPLYGGYDAVLLFASNNLSHEYGCNLHATVGTQASVANSDNSISLTIAKEIGGIYHITCAGIDLAEYSIFDALGRELSHSKSSIWNFDGRELPPGMYIVTASGRQLGRPITISRHIVQIPE